MFTYSAEAGFKDYRTQLEHRRSGRPPREVNLELERIGLPAYLRSAYLWVFVFKDSRQRHHRYSLLGEERTLDRPAIKIGFEPIPPYVRGLNDWFGIAWIDRDTSQLLKVEAYEPRHHDEKTFMEQKLVEATQRPRGDRSYHYAERIVTEFSEIKNGMRFPSSVEIVGSDFVIHGGDRQDPLRERIQFRIAQVYTNYRFFSVRTTEEIEARMAGQTEP